jgi:hypothetical protein
MIDRGPGSLGPDARALLDAARDGLSPDAAAVRRMRGKIQLATGGAAGTAIAIKLALLALVVVAAVGAGVVLDRRATVAEVPRVELASPPEARIQIAVREPALPPPTDEELITIEPTVVAPRRARPELPAGPPAPVVAAPPRGADLAREVELVDLAMAALRRGDPAGAIHAVQQHAAETGGRGQLAEDAAAIEVEALCHLHDPATSAKLEAFDARFPHSAQRSRLSSHCP